MAFSSSRRCWHHSDLYNDYDFLRVRGAGSAYERIDAQAGQVATATGEATVKQRSRRPNMAYGITGSSSYS